MLHAFDVKQLEISFIQIFRPGKDQNIHQGGDFRTK